MAYNRGAEQSPFLPHVSKAEVEPLLGRTFIAEQPCRSCGERSAIIKHHHCHLAHFRCAACNLGGRFLSHWHAWRLLHPGQEWVREAK